MGKIKQILILLIETVETYYEVNNNFNNIDIYIKEKYSDFYDFYLCNKQFIIETVEEIKTKN